MKLPNFSAQSALYTTSNRYRSVAFTHSQSFSADSVIAAYQPGPETRKGCNSCMESCARTLAFESGTIAAGVAIGCATVLGCPIAVAVGGGALEAAMAEFFACNAYCELPEIDIPFLGVKIGGDCCPKLCGIPDPSNPGSGCCDKDEHCVDQRDPNSRAGCCPAGQGVCGGKCCLPGEICCGDSCYNPQQGGECCGGTVCASGVPCCGDGCCRFPDTPPPPPPVNHCIFGGEPCGPKCCPPGLQCCNYSAEFGPDCKTSCLH